MSDRIRVEVVYALPEEQRCITLELPAGSCAMDAIRSSGLAESFGLDPETIKAGIFGHKVSTDTCLNDGDRVEIYRPLLLSPTEARRLRARTMAEKRDS